MSPVPTEFEQQMIDAILRGIKYASTYLHYDGDWPAIQIALDCFIHADGQVYGAGTCLDDSQPVLQFGLGVILMMFPDVVDTPENRLIIATFCGAHEMTHFVQWLQGRLPDDNRDSINTRWNGHIGKAFEKEADDVARAAIRALYGASFTTPDAAIPE